MEKRNLSGKTILKLIGALLALAYLGFCLYAGITGNFPSMHRVEHVMRFGDLKNWVSGGMSAVMIFAFCITSALNDLNLQKGRKKSFLPLFLTMILPIILLLLLESYLDIGWIGIALYAGIAAFLFGIAWIPQLLNQWTARRLLRDEPMSGRQQVRIIEWIHFHPLKKLLVFGLWGFWCRAGSARYLGNSNRKNRNGWRAFSVFTWHSGSGCGSVSKNETLCMCALPKYTSAESDPQQKTVGAAVGWRTL